MNNWRLKFQCIRSILGGRGVIYGMWFVNGVEIHPSQQNSIIANNKFGPMPRVPLNTTEVVASVNAWLKDKS